MHILNDRLYSILAPFTGLMFLGEDTLERIIQDPNQPLMKPSDQSTGYEDVQMYDSKTSLMDICRAGQAMDAQRLDVAYDFFFGGHERHNYPDSPQTLQAYKIIHDLAKEHGMGMSASIVSPLDTGGGYVKTHPNAGQTMQFQEGAIAPDGTYSAVMDYQTQWTNNKGPAKLTLRQVRVFAFDEERIADTPYYYVNENEIQDISPTAHYAVDENGLRLSPEGYGHGQIHISGHTSCGKSRFFAVVIYNTPELDYFSDDALSYMKSIVDLHKDAGITYDGIYSDEMHIQFDWDRVEHWGLTEVTTRYMTPCMAQTFADMYGQQYRDFAKYLIYFTYMHHDFLGGDEARLPAQHVLGRTWPDVVKTWQLRKNYVELLHRRVVDLCCATRDYMQQQYGHFMETTGHSTWEESPTCDSFFPADAFDDPFQTEHSLYDYTPEFVWSAASRENISACNDHFKWNEYFQAVGTDIPEGGFLDRNYYGAAYTAALAALNPLGYAYYCIWGSPDAIKERQMEIGQTYGHYANYSKTHEFGHNMVQGFATRISNVLTLCPMDLNHVEERFGNWMVQYGYTDYITEEKLLAHAHVTDSRDLQVNGRAYRALVVLYSPLMQAETLRLIQAYVQQGGTVIWCAAPALAQSDGADALWRDIFGVSEYDFTCQGVSGKGQRVHFSGMNTVRDMAILTDYLPDRVYPVRVADGRPIAHLNGQVVGTQRDYPGGGQTLYFGFRVRDDQSASTGGDVDTLFSILQETGCYEENGCEASSRPASSRYLFNRFPNGAVTLCNHFRTFRELGWRRTFYRDEALDDAFMRTVTLPAHDINLQQADMLGHRVSYSGLGIVTYNYDDANGLTGFVGRDTCGITIDGHEYRLTDERADMVFGRLDRRIMDPLVKQAYVVKLNRPGEMHLPFDATGLSCAVCKNHALDIDHPHPFAVTGGTTVITIDADTANKWIIFYKCY